MAHPHDIPSPLMTPPSYFQAEEPEPGLAYRATDLSTEAADLEYLSLGQGPGQEQGQEQGQGLGQEQAQAQAAGGVNSLQWWVMNQMIITLASSHSYQP